MMRLGGGPWQAAAALAAAVTIWAGAPVPDAVGAAATLAVTVDSLRPGGVILGAYAYCVPAKTGHVARGPNRNPAISWAKGPAGTASYAIVVVDTDVPTVFTSANKEGMTIPADLKRRDFYHFLLVDVLPATTSLPAGADSRGAAAKPAGPTPRGVRGQNDYGGVRAGYDGPCPPWNDTIPHHYHFQVYALNVARLNVSGNFKGADVVAAMQGHILAWGEVVGVYSLNPDVARTLK